MRYVVVGNSAAGLFAVEEIRRRDPAGEITVLTSESDRPYSRCLTTYFLAGDISIDQLYLRSPNFANSLNLNIVEGVQVTGLDPLRKCVLTKDEQEWTYDKLLIATGASAVKLTVPGANLPEVFNLRCLTDAQDIDTKALPGRRAVVVGGGLVSLKGAYALLKRGLKVTVVISSQQLLSQMLDSTAAALLQARLEDNGLQVILGTDVTEILAHDLTGNPVENHVQAVRLTDRTVLPADLVLVGKGVQPNIQPFLTTGLKLGKGIRVNSGLETTLPDVYAAGDVAETWDRVLESYRVNATWPNATTQGRIAGANMAGAKEIYAGSLSLNSVDFFGLSAISVGMTKLPQEPANDLWQADEKLGYKTDGSPLYQRLVWQGKQLKGFILVGDTTRAGILTSLVKEGRPLLANEQQKFKSGERSYLIISSRR